MLLICDRVASIAITIKPSDPTRGMTRRIKPTSISSTPIEVALTVTFTLEGRAICWPTVTTASRLSITITWGRLMTCKRPAVCKVRNSMLTDSLAALRTNPPTPATELVVPTPNEESPRAARLSRPTVLRLGSPTLLKLNPGVDCGGAKLAIPRSNSSES